MKDTHWADKRVIVTGGASFIDNHLAATHGGRGYINTHAPKGYVDEKLLMERLTV